MSHYLPSVYHHSWLLSTMNNQTGVYNDNYLDTTVEGTVDPSTIELFSFNGTEGQTLVLQSELFI